MATLLDVGLFEHLGVIFPFLLTAILTYAILEKTKPLGANKTINLLIGLSLGFFVAMSSQATQMVTAIMPWFFLIILFFVMIMVIFLFVGYKPDQFFGVVGANRNTLPRVIFFLVLLIVLAGAGQVFFNGNSNSETTKANATEANVGVPTSSNSNVGGVGQDALMSTLFHPKVLSFILLMLIAAFSAMFLIQKNS